MYDRFITGTNLLAIFFGLVKSVNAYFWFQVRRVRARARQGYFHSERLTRGKRESVFAKLCDKFDQRKKLIIGNAEAYAR